MEVIQNSPDFLEFMQTSSAINKRRDVNRLHFEQQVWPLRDRWVFISMEEVKDKYMDKLKDAKELSSDLMTEKPKEMVYKQDGANLAKRFSTGYDSEAVATAIFKTEFNKKVGSSTEFAFPDINNMFGVKSSTYGNCAMVEREPTGPQLIMIKDNRKPKYVDKGFYFCGLATVAMQLKYETVHRLTYTDAYYRKGKPKTGFYGYDQLIPVNGCLTLEKMRALIEEHEDRRWWNWL